MAERHPLVPAVTVLLFSLAGFLLRSDATQSSGKVARPEPADAAAVRDQIASVEKYLPQIPDQGAALYFLSAARQHLGETPQALQLLKQCLSLQEGFDPAGSPGLRRLKGSQEFDRLVAGVHRDFPAVGRASLAFLIHEKDLVPEGFAYDATHDVYYLSSLNRRKIVRIMATGKVGDFAPVGKEALLPVLGIRPNPKDGSVWAASWDEDSEKSELLHFGADGALLGRFAPQDGAGHGFNDLVINQQGDVIVTDSFNNQIYKFDVSTARFSAVPVHRILSAPNGIALAANDRQLFVADDFGVVVVDLVSLLSADVKPGPRNTLAGIDGLYWQKGHLIGVQNGIGSPRIAEFQLSKEGTYVTNTTILENRTAFSELPTTGAIHDRDFYFIVNSQIDNLEGNRIIDVAKLAPVRIGVIHLPP